MSKEGRGEKQDRTMFPLYLICASEMHDEAVKIEPSTVAHFDICLWLICRRSATLPPQRVRRARLIGGLRFN